MDNGRQHYQAFHGRSNAFFNNLFHSHDFYEIFIHISGGKIYQVEDQSFQLKRGDLMLMRPFHIHGHCGNETLPGYERMFLYITPEMLDIISARTFSLQKHLDEKINRHEFRFSMSEKQLKKAKACIKKIQSNCAVDTPLTRLHDISLLIEFMLIVLECMQTCNPLVSLPETKTDLMHQIVAYINAHFDQPLTLESIAAQFSISKSTLSHNFTEYAGHSVYDYILYCRFTYAKQLIVAGEPLTTVAYRSGFGDYSNFQRTFTRFAGCCASQYRKKFHANTQTDA